MDDNGRTFCQDLLKDVMTFKALYEELCKNMDVTETAFRRRFGGMKNIGNPDLAHRMTALWNALDKKLNQKEKKP